MLVIEVNNHVKNRLNGTKKRNMNMVSVLTVCNVCTDPVDMQNDYKIMQQKN